MDGLDVNVMGTSKLPEKTELFSGRSVQAGWMTCVVATRLHPNIIMIGRDGGVIAPVRSLRLADRSKDSMSTFKWTSSWRCARLLIIEQGVSPRVTWTSNGVGGEAENGGIRWD